MSTLTVVLLSFVIVAGVTVLACITLLRFWPALQRDRIAASAGKRGATESILRWGDEPRPAGSAPSSRSAARSAARRTPRPRSIAGA